MKAYGVKHIGPICYYGCCFVQTPRTSPTKYHLRRVDRNAKKRARAEAKRAIRNDAELDG
jgi:hypothetical protein